MKTEKEMTDYIEEQADKFVAEVKLRAALTDDLAGMIHSTFCVGFASGGEFTIDEMQKLTK